MPYDWEKEARSTGGAARIQPGQHHVRIVRVATTDRQGVPYASRDGDPQIRLTFQDAEAHETYLMVTLSERAGWVLAKVFAACDPPCNLSRMTTDGLEPGHFADQNFATELLVDRELTIDVEYETGKDGKEYPRVSPVVIRGVDSTKDAPAATPPARRPHQQQLPTPPAPPAKPERPKAPTPTRPVPPRPSKPAYTQDTAWEAVCQKWQADGEADEKARNDAWLAALQAVGKGRDEHDFTAQDWGAVVTLCADAADVPY